MRIVHKALPKSGSRCAVAVPFLVLLFLSTGCFQADQPQSRNLRSVQLGPDAIWPLGNAGVRTPTVRTIAADDLSFATERRDYRRGIADNFGEPFAVYSSYPIGSQAGLLRTPEIYRIGVDQRSASPRGTLHSSPMESAAFTFFNKPFGVLFANIFKKNNEESSALAEAAGEDTRNPFRDAKLKADAKAAAAIASSKSDASAPPANESDASSPSNSKNDTSATVASGASDSQEIRVVFLGDFDGSGVLSGMRAVRVDDQTFAFTDARRTFNLFANPAAVDFQRSMAIDDVNGDGFVDLLVTSRASLFGGVLLGDASGNFHLADSFLTGYEPTVVTTGPSINGMRDIVSLDTRTGAVATFRAGNHYGLFRMLSLNFLPDYVGHLVSLQDGLDYFIAARSGDPEVLYRWRDDGRLEDSGHSLPGDPSASIGADSVSQNLMGALQVYQVGPYASVILSNSRGQSFNVANMKLWPNVFLAIGDLSNQGTLDVAVAFLVSATPDK